MSTGSQFCPACPTDMPEHRATGRWVEVEGHEHPLPPLRPNVYLTDSTPGAQRWGADLHVWQDNHWLGAAEFRTQAEAMQYAHRVLVPLAQSLSERADSEVVS